MWSIEIYGTTPFNGTTLFPKTNIMAEVMKASKENPTSTVRLWGHCRARLTLLNGKYLQCQPNLSYFYKLDDKRDIADAIEFAGLKDSADWHDDESVEMPDEYKAMDVPTIHRLLTETIEAADPIVVDGKTVN